MEKGFEETTMDDIAERADVARTSVFNYFSKKTAFLDEWGTRRRQRAVEAIQSEHLEDKSASEFLKRYMAVLGELNANDRADCVVMMGASLKWNDVMTGSLLAPELSGVLEQARYKDQIRDEIDTQQAGLLLAVGYFAVAGHLDRGRTRTIRHTRVPGKSCRPDTQRPAQVTPRGRDELTCLDR